MTRRFAIASGLGAVLGVVAALAVLALAASRVIETGVDAVVLDEATSRARPTFEVTQGAVYLLISIAGALAGVVFGAVGYAVGREAAPDEGKLALTPLLVVGGIAGTIVGFASSRVLLAVGARTELGALSVSVYRAIVVAIVAGAVTGAIVAGTVERMSRAELFGFEGEAWPTSPAAFLRETMTAVGLPTVGALVAATVIGGFGWLLLEVPHEVGIWLFGGVAAVILIAATIIAANPPGGPTSE